MHLSDVGHINFNCKKLEIDMKVMCKLFTLVMFITAVTFVQSCGGGGGGGGGSAGASADGVTVSTETPVSAETPVVPAEEVDILELNGYLSEKSENTKESAYRIKITGLTVDNYTEIKTALKANPKKYTDLSATTLPDGITDMTGCFGTCISLTQAPVIPNSVTNMDSCFGTCISLTQAPVIPNSVTNMRNCFSSCPLLMQAPVIPNSVTNMARCFYNCISLTQAPVIPNSVTDMGYCFSGCTSLKTVEILTTICTDWRSCFYKCSEIVSITVPTENVKNSIINASGNDIVEDDEIVVKP